MTVVFFDNIAIDLPPRFAAGQVASPEMLRQLESIRRNRIRSRLIWRLRLGNPTQDEAQSILNDIAANFIFEATDKADDVGDDPLMTEAISLAREIIVQSLAKDGITVLPPNIDEHAKALAERNQEIKDRAKLRLEARYAAASDAMNRLGVTI